MSRPVREQLLALERAVFMYLLIGLLVAMFRGPPAELATRGWGERLPWIAWEVATWPRMLSGALVKARHPLGSASSDGGWFAATLLPHPAAGGIPHRSATGAHHRPDRRDH